MPSPVPPAVAADSSGLPDTQWITDVRDGLRDYPQWTFDSFTADGVSGVAGAAAAPIRVTKTPVHDPDTPNQLIRDNTAGVNFTVIYSGTPSATQVLLNVNTGELTWNTARANGNALQFGYYYVKWTNASIMTALYAGLRAMFPRVGKVYVDTSTQIQVNVWDYTLPQWAQDPRSRIISLAVRDPWTSVTPTKYVVNGWDRVGLTTLRVPTSQRYSPAGRFEIVGWGPYLQLGDLEPQLYHLPVWYALSVLLPKQESKRIREDQLVPMTQAGSQQPGLLTATGDYYAKRFEQELERLAKVPGPGFKTRLRSTYQSLRS